MTNAKYKILLRIYESTVTKPIYRKDFYGQAKSIHQNKKIIDELVDANLVREDIGSNRLTVTISGVTALEQDIERREDIHRISIQFWISAIFSLAALAVSITALILNA